MRRCGQMFRSGFCQERDWGPSWAQVGQSEGSHMLLSAQLWAQVWAHEDTHVTQLCTPQQCRACANTHTHGHAWTLGTPMNTQSPSNGKDTHSPHQNPLLPGAKCGQHPFFLGPTFPKPVSPTLSSPYTTPFPQGSPIQKHTGWGPSMWGGGGDQNRSLPSQTCFPPHSCPGTTPTSSPAVPTQDQAPSAHPPVDPSF